MADRVELLRLAALARSPSCTVAWCEGKRLDRAHLLRRMGAWRKLLRRTPGKTFALWLDDGIEFAAALFGAWQERKTICLPGDRLPATCAALSRVVDGFLGEFETGVEPCLIAAPDEPAQEGDPALLDPDFIGVILFTSGSTGAAQAIPKKLAQLSAELITLEARFGPALGAAEVAATVSHQHIYGLLFKILWPVCAGRAFHARSFESIQALLQELPQRDYVLVSSPAHLKRLPENAQPAWTLARPRAVFSSGGPLGFDVAREVEQRIGQLPFEVYGSSETGGIAWRQQRTADEGWLALPGVGWRVHDDEGLLEVRSAHLSDENWFRTADRATPLGRSHFLLKGRVDRIAKIEGKRISLSAIEAGLTASPWVQDARALVLNGRRQRIAAFVVPTPDGRRELTGLGRLGFGRALRRVLSLCVDPVGLPRIWRYLDALPVNSQGKTTQAELLVLLGSAQPRTTNPLERLVKREAQRAVFEVIAPRELVYFDGHFRQRPILAGVVQLDWVIAFGRRCFELPPCFRAVRALKFQRVIPPELPFALELLHEPSRACLSFKISSRLGAHASGRILFGAADV